MYNKIILVGNLTRDIEIRYTQSGAAIGNTGIATSRKFKSATGEQKEEVLFVDLTFFGRTAEIANQYLRKGSKVLVDGRLKLDQWTAQDGSKRSKHSVTVETLQMLDTKGQSEQMAKDGYNKPQAQDNYSQPAQNNYSQPAPSAPKTESQPTSNIPEIDINEDEIPF
jgi:single-strand DNA-binding protein